MENKTFVDKLNDFLLKENTFILLVMGAAASIFSGTFLYITYGTGIFSDVAVAAILRDGLNTGDYAAAAGFAAGFLIARVLEGPLVGVMDIGGSLMTGVGIGIPAVLLSMNINTPFSNFGFAIGTGAIIGLVIGSVVILVRKTMKDSVAIGGTSIMMGAGNATGRYLAPLIIIAAGQYNIYAAIGAIAGSAIFYKWGKEMTGGAILGAMILGGIFL